MSATEVKVPDIGDFKDVPVIELLVKPGDAVKKDESLLVLQSDKATLEVPAPAEGVVAEWKVKVGDKVSAGTLVAVMNGRAAAPAAQGATNGEATQAKPPAASPRLLPAATGGSAPAAAAGARPRWRRRLPPRPAPRDGDGRGRSRTPVPACAGSRVSWAYRSPR